MCFKKWILVFRDFNVFSFVIDDFSQVVSSYPVPYKAELNPLALLLQCLILAISSPLCSSQVERNFGWEISISILFFSNLLFSNFGEFFLLLCQFFVFCLLVVFFLGAKDRTQVLVLARQALCPRARAPPHIGEVLYRFIVCIVCFYLFLMVD